MRFIGRALLCALLVLSNPVLADDISNGSYSTTDGSNSASPPNGWPAGMPANAVEPSARSNMGATKRWWERANPTLSTTGSAGAYILTPTNTSYPTAYTQGEVVCAKANFSSVSNDTLNWNGLGAKALYAAVNSALSRIGAGTILSGQQFCASYDGALNSGGGGFQLVAPTSVPTTGGGNFVQTALHGTTSIASSSTSVIGALPNNTSGIVIVSEYGVIGDGAWLLFYANDAGFCGLAGVTTATSAGTLNLSSISLSGCNMQGTTFATGGATSINYSIIPQN